MCVCVCVCRGRGRRLIFCLSGKTQSYFFMFKVVKLFNKNLCVLFCDISSCCPVEHRDKMESLTSSLTCFVNCVQFNKNQMK